MAAAPIETAFRGYHRFTALASLTENVDVGRNSTTKFPRKCNRPLARRRDFMVDDSGALGWTAQQSTQPAETGSGLAARGWFQPNEVSTDAATCPTNQGEPRPPSDEQQRIMYRTRRYPAQTSYHPKATTKILMVRQAVNRDEHRQRRQAPASEMR